jgi:hypothetical protein
MKKLLSLVVLTACTSTAEVRTEVRMVEHRPVPAKTALWERPSCGVAPAPTPAPAPIETGATCSKDAP